MKKITTVGGGTGTYVVLSGLKKIPDVELSAIVSVADDGGSTGRLRDAHGYLPQGDLRQALVALAEEETVLRDLFLHRFSKGELSGHNFGNLFLLALSEVLSCNVRAIEEASKLLRIRGTVIPVSDTPAILCADVGGKSLVGQSVIQNNLDRGLITRLYLKEPCEASEAARNAITKADLIVLGPGDLYTSILANFVTHGLSEAVARSNAKLVYITNLFSTPESGQLTMRQYVDTVSAYVGRTPDVIVVNTTAPLPDVVKAYEERGQAHITDDLGDDPKVVRADVLANVSIDPLGHDMIERSLIRHDPDKLAKLLVSL